MYTKLILTFFSLLFFTHFNINQIYAISFDGIIEENNIANEEYLDFSYISFVIQMIIGGFVAGFITLIAYYGKFMNFISNLFNRSKKMSGKSNDSE
ncbi:MAG: hypothetical protein CL907_05035 [Dehalococcoidia bacterium]|nr:hypothetical protein [Gammaproteobacteria bacterium]MBH60509.1 hypothetical protein [Dehalococcoidia bacterium]|tara:strand:+ start:133 stop:420 length:288 start_codon:yes stop_codon:yes gene_type:complete